MLNAHVMITTIKAGNIHTKIGDKNRKIFLSTFSKCLKESYAIFHLPANRCNDGHIDI